MSVLHREHETGSVEGVGLIGSQDFPAAGFVRLAAVSTDVSVVFVGSPIGQQCFEQWECGLGIKVADDGQFAMLATEEVLVERGQLFTIHRLDPSNFLGNRRLVSRVGFRKRPEGSSERIHGQGLRVGLLFFEPSQCPLLHQCQFLFGQGRLSEDLFEQSDDFGQSRPGGTETEVGDTGVAAASATRE